MFTSARLMEFAASKVAARAFFLIWLISMTSLLGTSVTYASSPAKSAVSPAKATFITVAKDVKLEVVDWGGRGPPLVFLAGFGATAHEFDTFAPKFTGDHHVYGITRRGFGISSAPAPTEENYTADRLGDDVLSVIKTLKLDRPVLVGHSIAGEELSSIGSRHPEKVSGLIYLDSGYSFAFYDGKVGDEVTDNNVLRNKLALLQGASPEDAKTLIDELLRKDMPRYEKDLGEWRTELRDTPTLPKPPGASATQLLLMRAMLEGEQQYNKIDAPVLAIFAIPKDYDRGKDTPGVRANIAQSFAQAQAFQAGIPRARVIILPYASHVVFRSNELEVLREMNAFMSW